jgi:hypothetical protein
VTLRAGGGLWQVLTLKIEARINAQNQSKPLHAENLAVTVQVHVSLNPNELEYDFVQQRRAATQGSQYLLLQAYTSLDFALLTNKGELTDYEEI